MFMQFHGGVYRSDDAGKSWTDIGGGGLPSDFGFPLMVDPADPDSAYVIPLVADMDRVTPDGRVRVYETRDAGSTWEPRGDGLPAGHAYLTVLRQAFSRAAPGELAMQQSAVGQAVLLLLVRSGAPGVRLSGRLPSRGSGSLIGGQRRNAPTIIPR